MTGKLDDETWAKRLQDATRDGKLNVSYMDLPTFDAARVLEIKEKIPNLVELDLRSNDLADSPTSSRSSRTCGTSSCRTTSSRPSRRC